MYYYNFVYSEQLIDESLIKKRVVWDAQLQCFFDNQTHRPCVGLVKACLGISKLNAQKLSGQPFLSFKYRKKGEIHEPQVVYAFCRTCYITSNKGECYHSMRNRSFTGHFCFPELNDAISKYNYELVEDLHEVLLYEGQEFVLKELVLLLTSWKLKASIDRSKFSNNAEFESTLLSLNEKMGFDNFNSDEVDLRLKPSNVQYNKSEASFLKNLIVSFLGKFGQKDINEKHEFISIYDVEGMEELLVSEDDNIVFIEQIGNYYKITLRGTYSIIKNLEIS